MYQILGDFSEEVLSNNKLFMIDFFIQSLPVGRQKQTRYLSVAFITDYISNFFPFNEEDIKSFEKQLQLKSSVTYVTNELLENSMKFHDKSTAHPIKFGSCLFDKKLVFVVNNCVTPKTLKNFKIFVDELLNSDIDELYFRQLEKGAEEKSNESRLGFLSMINDYSAKLGWKIETLERSPESAMVTTMVQLRVS